MQISDAKARPLTIIPLSLTLLRALLAPVVALLAVYDPLPWAFGTCLILALLSDYFDGVIARRLKVASPGVRRLDSIVDTAFYLCAVFAVWRLQPQLLGQHRIPIFVLIGLEVVRYIFDFAKFKREASYHMWSSKLWGLLLFLAFFSVLVAGRGRLLFPLAIYMGIVADLEGLAISLVLKKWQNDVPSLYHAIRIRQDSLID